MPVENIEELIENFALFEDWEERYRYLIDIGRSLPHLDESFKRSEFLVQGCTSQVWLVPHVKEDILSFQADSDAHIVRGLVAILDVTYQGKSFDEIKAIDINDIFSQLGLDTHLSANRRSGFFSMVEKIHSLAGA